MKTISFSILFSTLQLFFNPLFFAFLQQFTASENLRVAGDSAGRQHILTALNNVSAYNNDRLPSLSCTLETVYSPPQRHRGVLDIYCTGNIPIGKVHKVCKKKEYMYLDSNKISETIFGVGFAYWDFIYHLAVTVSCK